MFRTNNTAPLSVAFPQPLQPIYGEVVPQRTVATQTSPVRPTPPNPRSPARLDSIPARPGRKFGCDPVSLIAATGVCALGGGLIYIGAVQPDHDTASIVAMTGGAFLTALGIVTAPSSGACSYTRPNEGVVENPVVVSHPGSIPSAPPAPAELDDYHNGSSV